MKLFNSLRKRIVRKLIRPEDGYTYTGEAVKFYCDDDGQYIVSMSDRYTFPTLTGWKEYDGDKGNLVEVGFYTWKHGMIANIITQYLNRLDDLSKRDVKSIRDYRLKEDGEKPMITKKLFCDIMKALDNYWVHVRALEGILNVYFEKGMMMDIIDKVVDALEEELEPQFYDPELDFNIDEDPLIMWWLTGSGAERTINGKKLSTAEDLYDYLVEKRETISGKKVSETP